MPSSLITSPENNQDLAENTTFQITVNTINMDLGHFTNAKTTYYSAPTFLDNNGNVIGHTHVTVQDLGGSFNPTAPLDPTVFAFFLGINTPADAQNNVFANVTGGLPSGFYRVCTMVANANHSPLQMPVAQRGAQDDCKYFSVGQGNNNGGNKGNNKQDKTADSNDDTTDDSNDDSTSTSTTSTAASTNTAAAKKGGNNGTANKGTKGTNNTNGKAANTKAATPKAANNTAATPKAASTTNNGGKKGGNKN
jgi:transcription initiation factor TFIID subunit 15